MRVRQETPPDPALRLGVGLPPPAPPAVMAEPELEPVAETVTVPAVGWDATEAPPQESRTAALWPSPVPTFGLACGPAGSGKTYATRAWAGDDPGLLLCATTGIAAINLGGETINSILGYFDTHSMQESFITGFLTARLGKLWKAGIRRLVLDEVSMLAADQLTYLVKAIDEVNGRGYVLGKFDEDDDENDRPAMGLTLVGDFLQLPPVKAAYAFESPEWYRFAEHTVTLREIRRQADPAFIRMLRAARAGHGEWVAEYFADRQAIYQETDDRYAGLTIVAKNESVDRYNYLRLAQLPGKEIRFTSTRWGKQRSEWGNPDKPKDTWGIPEQLTLKEGALVMVLANQRVERELIYVNGDLAELLDRDEDGWAVVRLQRTGQVEKIEPVVRQVKLPADSARKKELREQGLADRIDGKWEIAGAITYMPLRLAYASTVHKSQGLSLDTVQVNVRDHFFKTPGMLYVALSRCRTAEGLRVVGSPRALIERCTTDPRLKEWL